MSMSEQEADLLAVGFLHGFATACYLAERTPPGVDLRLLLRHNRTAMQIAEGGGFNPLAVAECLQFARELWDSVHKRITEPG